MQEKNAGTRQFLSETVLAFLYLKRKKCDIVVLETGMGGLLDATNIIGTTVLGAGLDQHGSYGFEIRLERSQSRHHQAAYERGIGKQEPEAEAVIKNACLERDCSLQFVDPAQITDVQYGIARQSFFSYKGWKQMEISACGQLSDYQCGACPGGCHGAAGTWLAADG